MIYAFGLAAFCVAWWLPGHYFPWAGFQQEVAAATGALLLGLACLASTGRDRIAVPSVSIGAAMLALIPIAQWATGQLAFHADAILPALYLVGFALTVIAARALAAHEHSRFVVAVMATLVVGSMVSATIGLGQGLRLGWISFVEQLHLDGRVFANFTQPNHLATLLGMGLAASWWLFEARRIGVFAASMLGGFIGMGLVMTQSRAGWAFFAFFPLWWLMARRTLHLRTTALGAALAVACFIAATAAWPVASAALDGSAAMDAAQRLQSVGGRRIHWSALWDAAWRQPFTGWGWLQVTAAQQAVALDHPRSHEWVTYSHSLLLDLLIWNGVVLGTLIIAAGTAWVVTRVRACRDIDSWGLLAAVGVVLIHSLVEFPYAYAYFLLPVAVFVGIVEAKTTARGTDVFPLPRLGFAALGLAMASVLAVLVLEYLEVEEMARRASFAEAAYVVPASQVPAPPDVSLIDSQREFIRFRITAARPGMSAAELGTMTRINQRFMPPAVMLRYSLAMALNGHADLAVRNLALLCQVWSDKQCEQGRESWAQAQKKFPQLAEISFPAALAP